MDVLSAAILGVVQGLTEFLPVSSSGHLVLAQSLIPGFKQPGIVFDVILHLGTLFAVLYFFRKKIFKLGFKYYGLIAVGTIPAILLGLVFKSQIEALFVNVKLVGAALILSGILNYLTNGAKVGKKAVGVKESLMVGVAQAAAIIPGLSRSGSTIFAGIKQGVKPEEAVEFSFLLSIPAILGANILELAGRGFNGSLSSGSYVAGFVTAFISGFLAIGLVLKFLVSKKFKFFAVYCIGLGILALLL